MLLNCGVGEDSWESLGQHRDPTSPFYRESLLNIHWKDWCWSWNSNTLATWCEELTQLKRPWCWERLKAGGEGDERGWDGWIASPIQRTWVWVCSGSWWWTGRPGTLQSSTPRTWGHCSPWGPKKSDTTEQLNWAQRIVMSPKAVLVASWNQNSLNLALISQVGNFPCLEADGNYCP